jgi:hypothetical protein
MPDTHPFTLSTEPPTVPLNGDDTREGADEIRKTRLPVSRRELLRLAIALPFSLAVSRPRVKEHG